MEETTHPDLSPVGGETQRGGAPTPNDASNLSPTDQAPVEAGFKPALVPSPTTEETQRGGTPHTQHLAPRTQPPASTAANAANSSGRPCANAKNPTAPAPPTKTILPRLPDIPLSCNCQGKTSSSFRRRACPVPRYGAGIQRERRTQNPSPSAGQFNTPFPSTHSNYS